MGIPTLITTNTATSNVTEMDFSSGITSAYDEYMFVFTNIDHAGSEVDFQFQVNATDGADYNDSAITSTAFWARHGEDDSTFFAYVTADDLAQGTGYQNLTNYSGNAADESINGTLWLFNPSNTTYVKHFYATLSANDAGSGTAQSADNFFVGGYVNSTSDIDAVDFKMDSGNFDGTIKLYGVG